MGRIFPGKEELDFQESLCAKFQLALSRLREPVIISAEKRLRDS